MVWGCFSANGVGDIHIIKDTLTSAKYVRILSDHMVPSARRLIGPKYVFQQDNDPKHTANNTKKWFQDKKIELLDWPAQSPDLNPIENLWNHLKQLIRKENITNIKDLPSAIERCWKSISKEYCQSLVKSMTHRIDETIKNRGLWANY